MPALLTVIGGGEKETFLGLAGWGFVIDLWIAASWGVSEHNRRAKYYRRTSKGRRQLDSDVEAWRALTAAVGHVLAAG